jgi:hypothetical protein
MPLLTPAQNWGPQKPLCPDAAQSNAVRSVRARGGSALAQIRSAPGTPDFIMSCSMAQSNGAGLWEVWEVQNPGADACPAHKIRPVGTDATRNSGMFPNLSGVVADNRGEMTNCPITPYTKPRTMHGSSQVQRIRLEEAM